MAPAVAIRGHIHPPIDGCRPQPNGDGGLRFTYSRHKRRKVQIEDEAPTLGQILQQAPQVKLPTARIAQDYPNVCAAWCTAVAACDIPNLLDALDGLYHFFMVRSRFQEGADLFAWSHQVLAPAGTGHEAASELRRLVAHLAARTARFLSMLSRHAETKDLLGPCLAELRALDDPAGVATALVYLGAACTSLGAYTQAQTHLQESLDLRRGLADGWGQAVCHLELTGLAFYGGDYPAAETHCAEGLRLAGQAGDLQITLQRLPAARCTACRLAPGAAVPGPTATWCHDRAACGRRR